MFEDCGRQTDVRACLYYKLTYEPKDLDDLKMAYFRFSHHTSMEILSCDSNKSTQALAIKNTFCV